MTGTHSHSWVMSFDSELEAFEKYAEIYPDNCLLLVDTYDTLKSGVPNAIKVFDELKAKGHKPVGIRLDSGDLAYLSRKARVMLDEAGHKDCLIFATNDLDEDILLALNTQDAKIDVYGIGTKLITSYNNASLGGVYKLCALEENGKLVPKIKVSNSHEKTTNPGVKKSFVFSRTAWRRRTLFVLKTRLLTLRSRSRFSTPNKRGRRPLLSTTKSRNSWCPFLRTENSFTTSRRSNKSATTKTKT